jgi:hypothetical protein
MLNIAMTREQKVTVTLNPRDAAGVAKSVSDVAWDAQGGPVAISPSGLNAELRPTGALGLYPIKVQANAGHSIIEDTINLEVVDSEAVALNPTNTPPVIA